ncbi:alpha-galactosidase [Draconibacterium orientale]|uniref:alpha-galactosidase n=1 Tax=Draconibacterium orientale TaxID=1168034 RepID=UPI002ABD171B|nr:alpha-galactosidase [Draconibacterium orientale]
MNRFYFIIVFAFLFVNCTPFVKPVLKIENDKIRKEFIASDTDPSAIEIKIIANDRDVTLNSSSPLFQFSINNQMVTSFDKIWIFKSFSERKMRNGGTEYILNFEVPQGAFKGLQVSLLQQVFPNSTLIHEKLVVSAKEGAKFNLSKVDGQSCFEFPCYQVKSKEAIRILNNEIRIASWEKRPITFGDQSQGNHMFYPDVIEGELKDSSVILKGPVNLISNGELGWFTAYEHASQDNTKGMFDEEKALDNGLVVDAMQGTKGVFNFPVTDNDFLFLGIHNKIVDSGFEVKVKAMRGAYLEGELIDSEHPYSSVWTATAFFPGGDFEDGREILRNYLLNQICENPASRVPEFYYNTWGMQRNDSSKPLRGVLTYERVFEEIEYADELGVQVFVLDDGWENAQGDWTPNKKRFPHGLKPIKDKLDEHGMKMGLWLSPMGIDSTTQRYKEHPEWVIKDSKGAPILAQWGHPAFDFVGDFYELFIDDCKKLIDQGCLFMKWDAINTFYSSLPELGHGDFSVSQDERRARYEYLLPIYVTRAMEELTRYEPELVIEIDLTEARRVMTGLAPLSQGKLYWMNNGASGYNDYSTYRAKSMRTIANEFAGIIPWELLSYANYPHNQEGALIYNATNSVLAGNGFWGNLALMSSSERKTVGKMVKEAKKLQPYLYNVKPEVSGQVGDSPEVYKVINNTLGAGKIVCFSAQPSNYKFKTKINSNNILAVLNTPYELLNNNLSFNIDFVYPTSSFWASIMPNNRKSFGLISSSIPIKNAELLENGFLYEVGQKGTQIIRWDKSLGMPDISCKNDSLSFDVSSKDASTYHICIQSSNQHQKIRITGMRGEK